MRVATLILCALIVLAPAVVAMTWTGGPGAAAETDFNLYLNGSTYSTIIWNVSAAADDVFNFPVYAGEQYVFGETLE